MRAGETGVTMGDFCNRAVIVVDRQERLQGIVSIDDVLALLAREMGDLADALGCEQVREARTRE